MLFNEPKLLKCSVFSVSSPTPRGFSALQRAEIAEIGPRNRRAVDPGRRFSALQRAEIAEIPRPTIDFRTDSTRFSALQRAEIAEIEHSGRQHRKRAGFQCSSTSRNC